MSARKAGFSLIETMAAMGIIFLVLGLAGALVSDYSNVFRRAAPRERLLEVIEMGAEHISSELSGALQVTTPSTGTSTTLVFQRIDPEADRLPEPPPANFPAFWDHRDPDHIMAVMYSVSSGVLKRRTVSMLKISDQALCEGLSGMSATRVNPRTIRVNLSVKVDGHLQNVVKEVALWVEP